MFEREWDYFMGTTPNEPKMVKVELLDPALRESYGPSMFVGEEKALLGVQKGKWRIREEGEKPASSQTYETRIMTAKTATPEEGPVTNPLKREDLYSKDYPTKTPIKKKHVAWVLDSPSSNGGAEISGRLVAQVGSDLGYAISLVTPNLPTDVIIRTLAEADLIVINNIIFLNGEKMEALLTAIYSDRKPYVKYEHDHRELQRPDFARRLFAGSVLNIFLSPIHLENHRQRLGIEGIALPLAFDVEQFNPVEGIEREPATALVCNVRNFKTWKALQAYIDEHPNLRFTIIARDAMVKGPNVQAREPIAHEKMPEFYSCHEYLVHLLDGWGAGERVVFEAALCGCLVVANERVGHMSWQRDLQDLPALRSWLAQAPYQFWREIEART
jgi:hypothetical protein